MITLTPNSTPKDHHGVVELFALCSDGKKYKERYDELMKIAALADKRMEEAQALKEKYSAAEELVKKSLHDSEANKARAAELGEREAALEKRDEELRASAAAANADLKKREDALSADLKELADRAAAHEADRLKLDQQRKEYEAEREQLDRKMAHARDFTSRAQAFAQMK